MVNALCRGEDPETFYANSSARGAGSIRQVEAAQRICFQCPVIDACAKYADDNQETWGVWGGVDRSPKNFKDKRWRELAMNVTRCGTSGGYRAHYKRGEKPCGTCREADARKRASRKPA
jgi:hypothetical protein